MRKGGVVRHACRKCDDRATWNQSHCELANKQAHLKPIAWWSTRLKNSFWTDRKGRVPLVSEIRLRRTDTTLDLSQKAENGMKKEDDRDTLTSTYQSDVHSKHPFISILFFVQAEVVFVLCDIFFKKVWLIWQKKPLQWFLIICFEKKKHSQTEWVTCKLITDIFWIWIMASALVLAHFEDRINKASSRADRWIHCEFTWF